MEGEGGVMQESRVQEKLALAARVAVFHGEHDQKSHGNRAGGGGSRIGEWKEPDSGATIEPRSGKDVVEGYAVSLQGFSSITPAADFFSGGKGQEKGRVILRDWIKRAKAAGYFNNPAVKIGIWHDGDHGEIVIDASEQVMDRGKAIRLGRERNQQGIYHLVPGGEGYIDTGGTGDREIATAASASLGDDRAERVHGGDDRRGTGRFRGRSVRQDPGPLGARQVSDPLLSTVMADDVVRQQRKAALADRVREFHLLGEHDQKSHGDGGGPGIVEGATVEQRGGSISGVVSSHTTKTRGSVRVLWEDGSVSEEDRSDLVVTVKSPIEFYED